MRKVEGSRDQAAAGAAFARLAVAADSWQTPQNLPQAAAESPRMACEGSPGYICATLPLTTSNSRMAALGRPVEPPTFPRPSDQSKPLPKLARARRDPLSGRR